MKNLCPSVQEALAEGGAAALRDDPMAQKHLETCDDCYALLENMTALDQALEALPEIDAPDAVVERLLANPELAQTPDRPEETATQTQHHRTWLATLTAKLHDLYKALLDPRWIKPRRAAFATAALVTIAVVTLRTGVQLSPRQLSQHEAREQSAVMQEDVVHEDVVHEDVVQKPVLQEDLLRLEANDSPANTPKRPAKEDKLRALGYVGEPAPVSESMEIDSLEARADNRQLLKVADEVVDEAAGGAFSGKAGVGLGRSKDLDTIENSLGDKAKLVGSFAQIIDESKRENAEKKANGKRSRIAQDQALPPADFSDPKIFVPQEAVVIPEIIATPESPMEDAGLLAEYRPSQPKSSIPKPPAPLPVQTAPTVPFGNEADNEARDNKEPTTAKPDSQLRKTRENQFQGSLTEDDLVVQKRKKIPEPAFVVARDFARQFLADRRTMTHLNFQPAIGYWKNTYIPGDPVMRHLQASLLASNQEATRASLEAMVPETLSLHEASQQTTQPFDRPTHSALATYLHADRRSLNQEGRLLVQVGLQATERGSGRRPALNLALVVDLSQELSAQQAQLLYSLVQAFQQSKDLHDRFQLVIAGPHGGLGVAAEQFQYGRLKVTLDRLLGTVPPNTTDEDLFQGHPTTLLEATKLAVETVTPQDDPTAPLGSSRVIVVTPQALGENLGALRKLAHRSAVAGIPWSVVGLGEGVSVRDIDALALAGQGQRRLLQTSAQASALVDQELASIGRTVARAVRLRIQLEPGVRLIGIVGSQRLDNRATKRVKQAEKAIDQRLARNLGLTADRGNDEAGIQIVIPNFQAGDSHVILLDVVAPGPGPIANVQVRYKDLVHFNNGLAQAQLTLPRGDVYSTESLVNESLVNESLGALERNVLKNFLAIRLQQTFEEASRALLAGNVAGGLLNLDKQRLLLLGLTEEVPGFAQDRDVLQDLAMLTEYVGLLYTSHPQPLQEQQIQYIAESLKLAGRLKTLPRPDITQSTF